MSPTSKHTLSPPGPAPLAPRGASHLRRVAVALAGLALFVAVVVAFAGGTAAASPHHRDNAKAAASEDLGPAHAGVEALDDLGRTIGRSHVVPVSD